MNKTIASHFNVGIPTGKINDIICIDIDNKDSGIEEFNKYILEYGTHDS
jgi:hypothetical protein